MNIIKAIFLSINRSESWIKRERLFAKSRKLISEMCHFMSGAFTSLPLLQSTFILLQFPTERLPTAMYHIPLQEEPHRILPQKTPLSPVNTDRKSNDLKKATILSPTRMKRNTTHSLSEYVTKITVTN